MEIKLKGKSQKKKDSSYSSSISVLMACVFASVKKSFGHATFNRNFALKFGSSKHGKIFRAYAAAEKVVAIYLLWFMKEKK